MKTLRLLPILLLVALAFAAEKLTVSDLLKDVDKHDNKAITLTGAVRDFEQKTSARGNDYFVFWLTEGDKRVNVFGHGKLEPAPKRGDRVEVTGRFRKEKRVGDRTIKNEIEVSSSLDRKFGVKLLKDEDEKSKG
jgi:hypothetical protein